MGKAGRLFCPFSPRYALAPNIILEGQYEIIRKIGPFFGLGIHYYYVLTCEVIACSHPCAFILFSAKK